MSTHSNIRSLKRIDPETASQPIADALALLPVINVFRAMANAEALCPSTNRRTPVDGYIKFVGFDISVPEPIRCTR
jgi:hypothetical protein